MGRAEAREERSGGGVCVCVGGGGGVCAPRPPFVRPEPPGPPPCLDGVVSTLITAGNPSTAPMRCATQRVSSATADRENGWCSLWLRLLLHPSCAVVPVIKCCIPASAVTHRGLDEFVLHVDRAVDERGRGWRYRGGFWWGHPHFNAASDCSFLRHTGRGAGSLSISARCCKVTRRIGGGGAAGTHENKALYAPT